MTPIKEAPAGLSWNSVTDYLLSLIVDSGGNGAGDTIYNRIVTIDNSVTNINNILSDIYDSETTIVPFTGAGQARPISFSSEINLFSFQPANMYFQFELLAAASCQLDIYMQDKAQTFNLALLGTMTFAAAGVQELALDNRKACASKIILNMTAFVGVGSLVGTVRGLNFTK